MKICFTSCMDAVRIPQQAVWCHIQAQNPDVLMLLGDQIYMDWGLSGTDWRGLIQDKPRDGLAAFAQEMHMRFAHQWAVPEFQQLICHFAGRSDPARLLVTWDDHDFAWNNALGEDGHDEAHRHGVPPAVKAVSHRLFEQFVTQLRTAASGTAYPPPPPAVATAPTTPADLFWQGSLGGSHQVPALLLDTRWHRQARTAGASMLGAQQALALADAIASPEGLLVVAGGTPMAYRYAVSQQAWHGGTKEPHYTEYAQVTDGARRPVLYLGGDVHRNAFSGVLPRLDGAPSTVVQVLSSGAAIGRYGPKRFAPSFGVVEVAPGPDHTGTVHIALWAQDKAGTWQAQPNVGTLHHTRTGWVPPVQGEAFADVDAHADAEPLFMLSARQKKHPAQAELTKTELEDFDTEVTHHPLDSISHPQPLRLQATATTGLKLDSGTASLIGEAGQQGVLAQMAATFAQARARGKASVVLYIHGFGKTFGHSAAQAYGLRAAYPECEPLLYTWAAGRSGGAVAALFGIHDAFKAAQTGAAGLAAVLRAWGQVARLPENAALAKVVLARSAGSVALNEALLTGEPGFGGALQGVDRIVLSAPVLKQSAFNRKGGLAGLADVPVFVTRNQNDRSLHWADWVDGFGPILGMDEDFDIRHPNAWCLDFTASARVDRLHDYMLPDINPAQRALHHWMLTERGAFDPGHASLSLHIRSIAGRVAQVS
ncbi:MAG: alkaline phosphatase D family protein [Burkholderiales bacterium]|nr:alkaline phosphatase D family protein [Burkholderiales bacterium]